MCEVMTAMAVTSAAITAGSAGYSAYAANEQVKQAKQLAAYNALLGEISAGDAELRGAAEAGKIKSEAARLASRQKVAMLAAGVDGASAGVLDVLLGTYSMGALDAETARNNGAREAWGFRNQAESSRIEGQVASRRAQQEMIGSLLGGAGATAGAVANVYGLRSMRSPVQTQPAALAPGWWESAGVNLPKIKVR